MKYPPQTAWVEAGIRFVCFIGTVIALITSHRLSGSLWWFIVALWLFSASLTTFIQDRAKGEFAYLQADDSWNSISCSLNALCTFVTGCLQLISGLDSTELFWIGEVHAIYPSINICMWSLALLLLVSVDTLRSNRYGIFTRFIIAVLKNCFFTIFVIVITISLQNGGFKDVLRDSLN
ncbi:MAG: hypothetical protein AAGD25_28025 [Cyanobacteria bacterium P01_F01_bin.150]